MQRVSCFRFLRMMGTYQRARYVNSVLIYASIDLIIVSHDPYLLILPFL